MQSRQLANAGQRQSGAQASAMQVSVLKLEGKAAMPAVVKVITVRSRHQSVHAYRWGKVGCKATNERQWECACGVYVFWAGNWG